MPSRQQFERTLIKLGKATPVGLRGTLGRATRPFRRSWRGSSVTVVVAVSDTATSRIGPCLDALRGQAHRNVDIRVAPYAEATRALRTAREHARADWRIRVEDPQPDQASAWNAAAGRSRAQYLVFVRGGDDPTFVGIERLVAALDASGSDLAVGRQRAPMRLHASVEPPYGAAHGAEVRGATLADQPVAVTDLGLGNRMLRRDFWEHAGLRFETGDLPGEQTSTGFALATYRQARSFDLLTSEVYEPTGRREGFSVGAVRDVLSMLDEWIAEHEAIRQAVEAVGSSDVLDWWLWGVLDTAVQPLLDDVERAGPEQWERLRQLADRLLESGGERIWQHLSSASRVKLWLVSQDRRDLLEEFIVQQFLSGMHHATEVRDGTVVAHLPFYGDPEVGVPESAFVMVDSETPLWAQLNSVVWTSATTLELGCYVRIDRVDMPEDPVVQAWLVEDGTGERVPLEVTLRRDPNANIVKPGRRQDYSRGAATLHVDAAELASRASASRRAWSVRFEVTVQGVTRTGSLAKIEDRGSAGLVDAGHLGARTVDGVRVGVRGRSAGLFRVTAAPWSGAQLVDGEVTGDTVRGRIRLADPADRVTGVRLVPSFGAAVRGRATTEGDLAAFTVDVPALPPGDSPRHYTLRVRTRSGGEQSVGWPVGAPQWLGVGAGQVVLSRNEAGDTEVNDAGGTLVAETLTHTADAIELTGRWLGTAPRAATVVATSDRARAEGTLTTTSTSADGAAPVRVTFPLTWDEWGLRPTALPCERYELQLQHGPTADRLRDGRVLLGEDLIGRMLEFDVDETHRFRPVRTGRAGGFLLMPPIRDDERSPYARAQLQQCYAECDLPVDPSAVYLQAYAGASATDSQLAIHRVLRERHPGLTLYWGIADRSSWVPEGGVPVILHSREYYRVMATAGRLVMNIDPDRWFHLRPGQQLLQTFHGYPAKSMGIRMWEAKGFTPRRVELELERTSASWSLILTPAPEMDEYYRREYRYDGPIHSRGYPRDDLLLSPDADRVREETRARLGIAPDQKVVLYAPTWRDDAATNWRRAELVSHLDLETASRKLGRDYVLLMRGHRFHAASTARSDGARLIDVTTYPEVNDLILASDAAVLDYSSLRFDFALTQRPMIFLVPDLDTYTGGVRGFLYPFEESAPGPLAQTADEVIGWLRDLDRLRREYADDVARFHTRFNYLQDGHSAESVVEAFFD